MTARLPITKTQKCYVGGAFIRSESGRVTALHDARGKFFANIPQCTRKDLRNAVEAAAKAGPVWANTFNKFDPTSPFGGYKESGFGREGGRQGLMDYCKLV